MGDLFDGYGSTLAPRKTVSGVPAFDEMFEHPVRAGEAAPSRAAYRELYQALAQLTQEELRGQPYGVAHPAQTWMRRHSRRHTKFGRDETPLCGGGCNRATKGVLKHRAFRPGANLPPNCDLVDMQSPSRLDAHNTRPAPLL